jgi:Uma2 family endonuclease
MSAISSTSALAELLHRAGDVPGERIVFDPVPGTATVADVIPLCDGESKRLCELVDGVLVEKAVGQRKSRIAMWLGWLMRKFLDEHNPGDLTGEGEPFQLSGDVVRFPDVGFVSRERIPKDADPSAPVPDWAPNLAIEVLGKSNTRDEMKRKLKKYFDAGVKLVWYVDPDQRCIEVFAGVDEKLTLRDSVVLTGGTVLPGFEVSVQRVLDSGQMCRPES